MTTLVIMIYLALGNLMAMFGVCNKPNEFMALSLSSRIMAISIMTVVGPFTFIISYLIYITRNRE